MTPSSSVNAVRQQAVSASLIEFTKLMYPGYQPAPFHLRIAAELEAVARGETRYLAIMMPPRHGKSLLSSQHFPAWFLGTQPDKRIIACSYGDDLAHTFSRHARNMLLDDRWPFPEVKPASDARSVKAWEIAGRHGGYRAAGVGSGITGHGANCLVGETTVETPVGMVDIGTLHRLRYRGWVRAFDHENNRPVWRRVVSSRELHAHDIREIVTTSGQRLRCTPDHRVFVLESGYRAASLLGRGDRAVSEFTSGTRHRPGLQRPDVPRQQDVPCDPPQVPSDAVALVRRVRGGAVPVYDLQVEGTSNFFANDILVHNCLLIDDAVKDKEQADSALMREKTWDWYQSTSYTRLDPSGGAVVLIGTRWHADDLIGRALRDGDYWRVLNFPAEAEEGDTLGREPGEWLWPELFSPERYQEIRARVGPRNWNALYQQRPSSEEGAMFPRSAWRSYRPGAEPALREVVISVDSAFKEGVGSDYSVFAVWGADGLGSYYVLDRVKERMEFPELIATGHRLYARWRERAATRKVSLLVEDRASGQSAIQVWSRVSYGPSGTLPALPVLRWNIPSGRSKASRADEVTHLILAGRVYLPDNASWVADFVQEHVEFPHGPHDDQVDTTSQALGWFLNQPRKGVLTF